MHFSEKTIDLHVHSTESDGTFLPKELIMLAKEKGLSAIALTDHDTTSGLPAARLAAQKEDIELISGIELSTDYNGTEVHILGYYIDENNPGFQRKLAEFCSIRDDRNKKMATKLQKAGFTITYEDLLQTFPDSIITRAHFARYLSDHGFVKDMNTAFVKYLNVGCRCYVPREKVTPFQAIDIIKSGGGVAYFAHPVLCRMNYDKLETFIRALKEHGLTGLEAVYSTYTPGEERNMKAFAKKYDLLISGGSDFHGTNKPYIQLGCGKGNLHIPYDYLQQMKNLLF